MNIPVVKELGTEMKVPTPCHSSVPRQQQDWKCARTHARTHTQRSNSGMDISFV